MQRLKFRVKIVEDLKQVSNCSVSQM